MGLNQLQLLNLKTAASSAAKCWQDTGIPCELTVAQWAIESGWGNHQPNNNCFGIKDYAGSAGRQLLVTIEHFTDSELATFLKVPGRTAELMTLQFKQNVGGRKAYRVQDWFAIFPSLTSCFNKRAALFLHAPYYAYVRQYQVDGDLVGLINGISEHYATSPDYPNYIKKVISMPEVESAIEIAKRSLNFPPI